jgi:hypothetical protein
LGKSFVKSLVCRSCLASSSSPLRPIHSTRGTNTIHKHIVKLVGRGRGKRMRPEKSSATVAPSTSRSCAYLLNQQQMYRYSEKFLAPVCDECACLKVSRRFLKNAKRMVRKGMALRVVRGQPANDTPQKRLHTRNRILFFRARPHCPSRCWRHKNPANSPSPANQFYKQCSKRASRREASSRS